MIPDSKIAEIRERTDIVALVSEYVPLKRIGSSHKGLCPFHAEKTPSFYVHQARQFYHCFGCQASGDVISFVMQLEGRTFPEAARTLAERAGIELPSLDPAAEAAERRAQQRLSRLAALTDSAAGYFIRQLADHPLGGMARAELDARGVLPETATTFRLGYAPDGWEGLVAHLAQAGFSPADAEEVGLIVPRRSGSGHYDRFRHRLMFPIADVHGRIVAFSGRRLPTPPGAPPPAEEGAKYVNSPEGPLYKKGEILYGLHEGRVAIRREGRVVVCEGNFDLVGLHQAGFENAVAPMGTALTEAHARLLRRYSGEVVLLFDGDDAGRRAVRAAHPVLARAGISVRVATLPGGTDPDSFLRAHGRDALERRIKDAPGVVEHLIDDTAATAPNDARGRAEAVASLGPVLAGVESPVELRLYIERVARKFDLSDLDAVRQQLKVGARSGNVSARKQPTSAPKEKPSMAAEIVGALLDCPELFGTPESKDLGELLTNSDLRAIFLTTSRMVASRGCVDGPALLGSLDGNPLIPWLRERLAVQEYDAAGARKVLIDGLRRLLQHNIARELPRLKELIVEARRLGDEERATKLTEQYVALFASSKK